jgi:putative phosphoesterase
VRELVDEGAATPGEIVLLFAAGTDAEAYEEELRRAGLPTYRATGRGYFGQQQVVDLLEYLLLLQNRYDDRALVSVLASPFVGVSNDALVLIRRVASKRPLFTGIEKGLPPDLPERDANVLRAFLQRYERLVRAVPRLSLERLCERIVSEHDYDLAVLAQWDGRRRYANLRKLARLARSYEELRGPEIEGFVRFVRDQEAVGAKELEAVAEEEGSEAVRLLTIHAAKGLEFKVVVVADAGRDKRAPDADEILALSDGRFGFRVADPSTSKRRGAFDYDAVRRAREEEERTERLRLYYVAMTRAIDRLIVSGAIDRESTADRSTPMGWVLERLDAGDELAAANGTPLELDRGNALIQVRFDRFAPEAAPDETVGEPGQLALFEEGGLPPLPPPAPTLPELAPIAAPAIHHVRRLSFTALSLFEACSYRYFAERVAGMRSVDVEAVGHEGLSGTAIGSAVHAELEHVDLASPGLPDGWEERVRASYPSVTDEEVARIRALLEAYCASELAARVATLEGVAKERHFTFEHDGVLLHGFLDTHHSANGRAVVVDYKTNVLEETDPEEVVDGSYRLQRLVYALACFRAGAEEVEVVYQFLEQPDRPVATTFTRDEVPELEAELSAAIARLCVRGLPRARCRLRRPAAAGATGRRRSSRVVRVAALYDVHGNLPALDAVLAEVEREEVDRIVFGGDVISGPWPAETLERVRGLGDRALVVLGNADRDLEPWRRERLGDEGHDVVLAWPLTVSLDVDGLGRVLFCHATPRSDEEIVTRLTPEERLREILDGVEADVVVHGHVHVRYDRRAAGVRIVNPGSVGLPYETQPGAYWAILGPHVEHRRSDYDIDAMIDQARALDFPNLDELVQSSLVEPLGPDAATEYFEQMARGA